MNVLIRKLENFTRLSPEERRSLDRLAQQPGPRVAPRHDLIAEGQQPTGVYLILEGWACRWKALADGRRQILSLCLPGDLCDGNGYLPRAMDHSIGALTQLKVAEIPREMLDAAMKSSDRITRALWWSEMVALSVQREWTLNVGQRSAYERIAHLLCETFVLLNAVGLTRDDSCEFPLVQQDLGDATGLTSVHVNRTLQDLRREGLIVLQGRRLTIPDFARLKEAAMFTSAYLHLQRDGRPLDAAG